jgi:hypothetical protein
MPGPWSWDEEQLAQWLGCSLRRDCAVGGPRLAPGLVESVELRLAPGLVESVGLRVASGLVESVELRVAPGLVESVELRVAPGLVESVGLRLAPGGCAGAGWFGCSWRWDRGVGGGW